MSLQEFVKKFPIEISGTDFRWTTLPPIRRTFTMMKSNVPELARIGEYKRSFPLNQDEVVVFGRLKIGRFDVRFAGHSEVNEKEIIPGKFKQHLFAASF